MRYCTVVRDIRALARARVLYRSQALGHFPAPIGTATSGSNTITNHSSHISTLGATGEDGELANSESSISGSGSGSGSATSWQQISKSAEPESDYHSPRSEKRRNLRTSFKLARSGSSNSSNSKLLERERRHSELVLPHAANNNSSDSHAGHESSDGAVVEHSADGTVKVTLQGGQYSIELTEGLVADARLAESISACVNAVAKKAAQQHRKSDTSLGSRTSRIGAFIFS